MDNWQNTHQKTLRILKETDIRLKDNPVKALEHLLDQLREFISCETICLLVWDENKERLITTKSSNLPKGLKPEEYEYDKGLTGKYIFANENWFRGTIDCENKRIYDDITKSRIEEATINWTNIQAFREKSEFGDFKSLMGFPFVATRQWRGVLKFINKIEANGNLSQDGFTEDDQIVLLINFLQKLEHIVALEKNNFHVDSILKLQGLTTEKILIQALLEKVVNLCARALNYKVCSVRIFEGGNFKPPVANNLQKSLSDAENKEYSFSENLDEPNFKRRIVWSEQDHYKFPRQIVATDDDDYYELSYFPEVISKFTANNILQSYVSIPISHQGDFFGILECGARLPQKVTKQDIELIESFTNALALVLVNIRRSGNLERMAYLGSRLASKQDAGEIYEIILDHIVKDLGFDYAVISRVNHENKTVKIKSGKTAYENLVDPIQWRDLANYTFNDKDILVDLVNKPEIKIINGLDVAKNWDESLHLNKEIFDKYNHHQLIRVLVPIVFQDTTRKKSERVAGYDNKDSAIVVSIIEAGYHTSHQTSIPEHQIELVKLFGNYAESIYKALSLSDSKAVDRMFQLLNSSNFPMDPISEPSIVYENLIRIICKFMSTGAVGVWEKVLNKESFNLLLVSASEQLKYLYERHQNIKTLPKDCYTFSAVENPHDLVKNSKGNIVRYATGDIWRINEDGLKDEKCAYSSIPFETGYNGMVFVPMKIGKEIYSAITIFTKNKTLSHGEAEALSVLAARAAVVVQSAKVIESFKIFSEISPDADIETVLDKVAEHSLSVLHANSVVLFRYHNGEFLNSFLGRGDIYHKWDKHTPIAVNETDLLNKIIQNGSHTFNNEKEYLKYIRENNVQRTRQRFQEDFWHREKLKSSAALKLEIKRRSADNSVISEPVGVMFINYRTEQNFNEAHENLMEAFGSLAATAIYNTYLLDQNIKFWETRRRDSFALSVSEIVSGLAHNSGNLVTSILTSFNSFIEEFRGKKYKSKTSVEKDDFIDELISDIEDPLNELNEDFKKLERYRKFGGFGAEPQMIIPLINSSIMLLNNKFQKNDIKVNTKSMREDAVVLCDANQIQHLFLNLFINAVDAMGKKGELSLGTEISHDRDFIIVRVSDTGRGISQELHNRIFEPFFTTKERRGGTGLGLPISKYIAEMHNGHIEFGKNTSGGGTSFYVHLPINKERKK
jgi:signal transduction histidine kinase